MINIQEMTTVSVVTGANKGVGFGIVRALCQKVGGVVILTARNEERGIAAKQKLLEEGLEVQFEQLDITDNDSIFKLTNVIKSKYGGIDILCNNAGIAYKNASTAPLLEKALVTNGTNFLATVNVTQSFLPCMKSNGKICQVSSMSGILTQNFPDASNPIRKRIVDPSLSEEGLMEIYTEYIEAVKKNDYSIFKKDSSYSFSKCLLTAHTQIMGRKLSQDKRNILINCCCPGYVDTDMSSHKGPLTIDEGAVTPVMVCLMPQGSKTGQFYRNSKHYDWEHNKYF